MNRSSDYRRPDFDPELMFRFFTQIPENPGDQIFKGVPSTENLRAVEVAATQKRLERLNQSPLHVRGKIVLDALWAGPRLQSIDATFLHLLKIQQRPICVSHASQVRELGKLNPGAAGEGD
jgi:hypothetical protein